MPWQRRRCSHRSRLIVASCSVPHPRILSFANSGGAEATKSGTTITFGPYESIAPLAPGAELSVGSVHYLHDSPVISLVDAERHVEISHWGDNAAVEDRLWLRNDGPQ
jgi:oligosaccharyltransferase complex subunit alpha (ribophorin I)